MASPTSGHHSSSGCPHLAAASQLVGAATELVPVSHLGEGDVGWVRRVDEPVACQPVLADELDRLGLFAGTTVRVERWMPDGSIRLRAPKGCLEMSKPDAHAIIVMPGHLGEIADRLCNTGRSAPVMN